MHEFYDT
jgi:hypothetical protein